MKLAEKLALLNDETLHPYKERVHTVRSFYHKKKKHLVCHFLS